MVRLAVLSASAGTWRLTLEVRAAECAYTRTAYRKNAVVRSKATWLEVYVSMIVWMSIRFVWLGVGQHERVLVHVLCASFTAALAHA
jgi:hypothetical protein